MSTYALVTKAGAADVTGAVRAGRVGGYVAPDLLGTIVLFDPPDRTSATTRRLLRPAAELVKRSGVPAWLLLGDEEMSEAVMISAAGPHHLSWVAGWDPPADPTEYLAHRQSWDAHCAEVATAYGAPHRATELSMVRNDPIPRRAAGPAGRPAAPCLRRLRPAGRRGGPLPARQRRTGPFRRTPRGRRPTQRRVATPVRADLTWTCS